MKPTHKLKVLDKTDSSRTEIGTGWLNKDGSISITLNPTVVLTRNKDLVITLFKLDVKRGGDGNDEPPPDETTRA